MGVVAVKVLFHNLWMPPRALELSAREAFVWSQLKHPNIVPFLGLANLAKISAGALPQLCLISPWMVEGNIMEYLARHEDTDRLKLLALREASIWASLGDHRNIASLLGIAKWATVGQPLIFDGPLCLISKWYENGNMMQFLHKNVDMPRTALLLDIVHGLQHLHKEGVVHGDLKGNNILIDIVEGNPTACLIDFGQSYVDPAGTHFEPNSSDTTYANNLYWLAWERHMPEKYNLRRTQSRSTASDVFELMRTFYEIITLKRPSFETLPSFAVVAKIISFEHPTRIQPLTDEMWALMERAWHREPHHRATLTEIEQLLKTGIAV